MSKQNTAKPAQPARRKALSSARILDAVASILRQDGVEGLSIRRLATQLKVSPMAVYRHFANKDAILSALMERSLGQAQVLPASDLAWDQWLLELGLRMHAALGRDQVWQHLLRQMPVTDAGLEVLLRSLQVLREAGFSERDAVSGFFAVAQAALGTLVLDQGMTKLPLQDSLQALDTQALQQLQQSLSELHKLPEYRSIQAALELVIDGLRYRLAASH